MHHLDPSDPRPLLQSWHWLPPLRGEHFRRCSYCGSIHPADLAADADSIKPIAILTEHAGREIYVDWSDRKYGWPHKFYVHVPNKDPEALFVTGSSSHPGPGFRAWDELTKEEKAVVRRDGDHRKDTETWFYQIGTRGHHFGKFYSVHLNDSSVDDLTRKKIEKLSGLKFTWLPDGRVKWESAAS